MQQVCSSEQEQQRSEARADVVWQPQACGTLSCRLCCLCALLCRVDMAYVRGPCGQLAIVIGIMPATRLCRRPPTSPTDNKLLGEENVACKV